VTALGNQDERNRIIAMKAYELFCSRGCEHGFDLDDWLSTERELSSEVDDIVIMQYEVGFDISTAERPQQERLFQSRQLRLAETTYAVILRPLATICRSTRSEDSAGCPRDKKMVKSKLRSVP
jgi:Protein of unknown function (DUF2934)